MYRIYTKVSCRFYVKGACILSKNSHNTFTLLQFFLLIILQIYNTCTSHEIKFT